jgi:hypothetical protein
VWNIVEPHGEEETYTKANSPYAKRFRQGAILVPRMLVFVEEQSPGPLQPSTHVAVRSRRGRLDKKPWRTLPDLTGTVERIFLRPAYLGEHCLPFRMLSPGAVVIPFEGPTKMSGDDERIDRFPGLADWWRRAERVWLDNRSSDKRTLLDQVDYIKQLSAQFPTPSIRVVYTKAGNHLTSAIVTDEQAVIDHMLYWGAAAHMDEAHYLTAILNSPSIADIVAPYQSRGAFGARHFDKYVWYPPIPEFDASNNGHSRLVALGREAAEIVAAIEIPNGVGFQRVRGSLREVLERDGIFDRIDVEVRAVLSE